MNKNPYQPPQETNESDNADCESGIEEKCFTIKDDTLIVKLTSKTGNLRIPKYEHCKFIRVLSDNSLVAKRGTDFAVHKIKKEGFEQIDAWRGPSTGEWIYRDSLFSSVAMVLFAATYTLEIVAPGSLPQTGFTTNQLITLGIISGTGALIGFLLKNILTIYSHILFWAALASITTYNMLYLDKNFIIPIAAALFLAGRIKLAKFHLTRGK